MAEPTDSRIAIVSPGDRQFALGHPLGQPRTLWMILAALLAVRLMAMCEVPLIPEEAYYWIYGQNPQLSYYDHPPMVAWVIRLGTLVFGNTELGVRIAALTLIVIAGVLMYQLARMWFGRAAAGMSVLLIQVLPVYFGVGFVAPMDAALCAFWLVCLLAVSHALRSGRLGWWYVAGAALGGALLSKYSAMFLAAGVFLAVVGRREWRGYLRTVHPYVALVLAAVVFSPVVIWNAQHDWASFRFQFRDRYAEDSLNFVTFPGYLATQLLVLTPVPLAAAGFLGLRLIRRWRRISQANWFAIACAVPGLAAATWTSLRSEVRVNWTAPILLSIIPAACALVLAHDRLLARRPGGRRRWQPAMVQTVGVCGIIVTSLLLYLMVVEPRLRLWRAFGPWRDLAAVVEEQEDRLERETGREPRVVGGGQYRLASVLAFYRMPNEEHTQDVPANTSSQWVFGQGGLAFEYWSERGDWTGADVIYVAEAGDRVRARVRPWFESIEEIKDPRLAAGRGYQVFVGRGLRARPLVATSQPGS
jgi:dolichol-phosphate mannosyltransferase